ncbi:MAG TPA: TolC family protein [Longimicrobiales bacterium]
MHTKPKSKAAAVVARAALRSPVGLLLLFLLPGGAPGQEARSNPPGARLTLVEAARLALERYPAVAASDAQLWEAESAASKAASALWPTVQLSATAMRFEEPMLVTPLHVFDPQAPAPFDETLVQGTVTARYTVWDGGERSGGIERARSESRAAAAGATGMRSRVVWQVTEQYARALAARESLLAHEQRVRALEEERDRARHLFESGRAAEVQVLRANAALAQADADLARSATQLDVLLRELARLIGAPDGTIDSGQLTRPRLTGTALLPREQLVARALENNPDVLRATAEVAAAGAGVKLARGAFMPDVQLVAQYDNRGSADGDFFREWSVGGAVSVPLFQGGARLHEMDRAQARRDRSERQLELSRLDTQNELDHALAALHDADARERSLRSAVEQYTAVVKAEKLALDAGVGTQTDYLAAHADLLEAHAQLANAVMSGITARAGIARITGDLTVNWLREHMENDQ